MPVRVPRILRKLYRSQADRSWGGLSASAAICTSQSASRTGTLQFIHANKLASERVHDVAWRYFLKTPTPSSIIVQRLATGTHGQDS